MNSIEITQGATASMNYGDTLTLTTDVATGYSNVWSVTDGSSVSVDATTGVVTTNSIGKSTVTVTLKDNITGATTITDTIEITVDRVVASIEGVTGVKETYTVGEEFAVQGAILVKYTDSDTAVSVPITSDMVSYFNTATTGEKTVTLQYEGKVTTFNVNVYEGIEDVYITGDSTVIAGNTIQLTSGLTKKLTGATYSWAITSGENSVIKLVSGGSSDTAVFEGVAVGNAEAKVTISYGGETYTKTANIAVLAPTVTGISITGGDRTIDVGEVVDLEAVVTTNGADYTGTVSWSSSNTGVVSVNGGEITAESRGEATITATAGGESAAIKVTVVPVFDDAITGITLVANETILKEGNSASITVTGNDGTVIDNTDVTWSALNGLASVSSDGVVTATAGTGTAIVQATLIGTNISATIAFNIVDTMNSIEITQGATTSMNYGDTLTLTRKVSGHKNEICISEGMRNRDKVCIHTI